MRPGPLAKRYIVHSDKNLDFTYKEVTRFERLYKEGYDLNQISRKVGRSRIEVLLLYLDLVENEKIENRYRLVKI